jgi:hypothetical protein
MAWVAKAPFDSHRGDFPSAKRYGVPFLMRPENVRGKRGMRGKGVSEHTALKKTRVGGSAERGWDGSRWRASSVEPYAP